MTRDTPEPSGLNSAVFTDSLPSVVMAAAETGEQQPRRVHHRWVAAAEVPLSPSEAAGVSRARAVRREKVIMSVVDVYCGECRRSFTVARHTDCDVDAIPRGGPTRGKPRSARADEAVDGLACTG
jgi:hypothetical protein